MQAPDRSEGSSSAGADSRLASAPRQFVRPQGVVGTLTGWALRLFNGGLNRRAVEALPLTPQMRVLEIGFGPGHALSLLARRLPRGTVSGVDPSEVMMRQARRRNARAVQAGRMDLREGTADHLPWPEGSFHAVLSLNNVLFWRPLEGSLLEIRRVLLPEGTCLIGLHGAAAQVFTRPGSHASPKGSLLRLLRLRAEVFTHAGSRAFPKVDRYLLPAFDRAGLPVQRRWEVRTATGRGVLYLLQKPTEAPSLGRALDRAGDRAPPRP